MNTILSLPEARVLGCLIEKEMSTPEYYPLTLNSLVAACNQKNNRDPVVEYDEKTVARALDSMREKQLVLRVDMSGSRVPKYKHFLAEKYPLNQMQMAILCTLLLRGFQTVGELRGRSERFYPFRDLEHAQEIIDSLISGMEFPFVKVLPRQPGRKEVRYAHLFCGEPEVPAEAMLAAQPRLEPATLEVLAEKEKQNALETELSTLKVEFSALKEEMTGIRDELAAVRAQLGDFKRQFE
ncbi:MAG: YceH family protein [Verrucomicrobiota bacterium]|nr:YceH family protein [Verrucomicrobiota bacterium]